MVKFGPGLSRWLDAGCALGGGALLATVVAVSWGLAARPGEAVTLHVVHLALAWYAAGVSLMLSLNASDWHGISPRSRLARWCWTWACVSLLVHVGLAFHHFHHWSHADAFDHTRQVGGLGEGIYFSYLLMVLWLADVCWWWARPLSYAAQPAWLFIAWQSFLGFMMFNATVIFGRSSVRVAGLAFCATAVFLWLLNARRRRVADGAGRTHTSPKSWSRRGDR